MTLYQTPGVREAVVAAMLRASIRLLLKPVFSPRFSVAFQRRWVERMTAGALLAPGVSIEPAEVGGVPGEWLRPPSGAGVRAGVMLHVHGGAHCLGSAATYRALTTRLALLTGLPVFVPDYRLAPEHPFPAGFDDTLAVFKALSAEGPVVLSGDSAGGGLALAAAVALRDEGAALPVALVLLSPWVDLVTGDESVVPPRGEAMLSIEWARSCAAHYLGGASSPSASAQDPRVSPLRADLRGLPPTLVQAGTDEMLHEQALRLHARLQAAGVASTCDITAGRWHLFQTHGGLLRSADEALERIARFVRAPMDAARGPQNSRHEVVILGAGMSGLCMAIQLKRAGIDDFVILEKQPGLGGTWWDNTYPGAHVDVPAPLYSFSFAPNPGWTRRFAAAPEIQAYMQALAVRHGLLAHMRLATCMTEARFDEASGVWHVATDRGDALQARFFVCSTGPLSQVRWPDIPGLADFQGQRMHSARWDHGHDMAGQRVAVIGTGSTASQLVPPIADKAQRLHVFQRTANWVLPRSDRPYGVFDRLLARLPPYAALVRWSWMQLLEWGRRGFEDGTLARRMLLKLATSHLHRQVSDPALRQRLVPPYPLGCKRLIYSNDFYPALGRANVELVSEPITCITAHGIVTADGCERPIDTLVCATGFDAVELLSSVAVTGVAGRTLREAWQHGPEAYHGITVAGFPNLFLMLGPNTGTGHTSTLLYIEPEVDHAIACMKAVRERGHRWIDVRGDVFRQHNHRLQSRLEGSVWSHCRSWYRMDGGRIVALFPGYTREYVQAVRQPDFAADYRFG